MVIDFPRGNYNQKNKVYPSSEKREHLPHDQAFEISERVIQYIYSLGSVEAAAEEIRRGRAPDRLVERVRTLFEQDGHLAVPHPVQKAFLEIMPEKEN
ncbi:MAG: hypothetical protein KAT77_03795 [Nanoarchaeota archaeon]|nr:hypothetical protein [Nanoarchaeota archaeon]